MFTAPTQGGGDSVKVADLAGKLLIITPIEHKREITTVHGVTDAVEVDLVDLAALRLIDDESVVAVRGDVP
jgi:hypothetical protein